VRTPTEPTDPHNPDNCEHNDSREFSELGHVVYRDHAEKDPDK
jgi:hypothetical protein